MPLSALLHHRPVTRRSVGGRLRAPVVTVLLVAVCLAAVAALPLPAAAAGWADQTSGTTSSLRAVDFADALHGWAAGEAGVVRATANGGATWSAQASGTGPDLYGVAFGDASHGWAVGLGGAVVATATGGAGWSGQASGVTTTLKGVSALGPASA